MIINSTRLLLFTAIYFVSLQSIAQDYREYHKAINKAEEFMFIKGDIDLGIKIYNNIFNSYDFVYTGDCLIAMQMALYKNNERAFLNFTKKAFQNGLSLKNFKKVWYIKNHNFFQKDTIFFEKIYSENRAHYLNRIDTNILKQIYYLFMDDQLEKNSIKKNGIKENNQEFEMRYKPALNRIMNKINEIITSNGVPLDRIIGISQKDLMKELKVNFPDLMDLYLINKNKSISTINRNQLIIQEELLYSSFFFPIIIHYQNLFRKYDSTLLIKQIGLGNIHPKDVAFLNDNFFQYNWGGHNSEKKLLSNTCYYSVGMSYNKLKANSLFVADSIINKCRTKLYIAPIEQDRAKWVFMIENKMNFGWGYNGCRS
ncbi:MAG: hypothetical protein QM530_05655 [Phycisphaerales bacterium]|nr:hypothetical protein [Phycisphaerales bacterium]